MSDARELTGTELGSVDTDAAERTVGSQRQVGDSPCDRAAWFRDRFPDVLSEGRIDLEKLRAALGEADPPDSERFLFTWAGKREAIRLLERGSRGALVPDPEASIAWDDSCHVSIEGENLEVLKLLYRAYFGRVKLVYIDPPYNTGNDFIYRDDYADPLGAYLEATGQADEEGNVLTSRPETAGRFHSAWMSTMYPRLFLARQLLREDGAIFVSIDDNELHHLRMVMNEIFGEENFIATVIWQKVYAPKNTARHFSVDHDYIVVYARNAEAWRPNLLPRTEEANARYSNPDDDPRGPWKPGDLTARNYYSEGQYEVTSPGGKTFRPSIGNYWRISKEKFAEWDADGRIWWGEDRNNMPAVKRFLSDVKQGIVPQTLWTYEDVGHTQEAKKELLELVDFHHTENVLNTVKPTRLIRRMLRLATDPEEADIVLDFFAGSASTAQAVLEQNREDGGNRRFVCVQFPEPLPKPEPGLATLADVGLERIRSVIERLEKEEAQISLEDEDRSDEDLGCRVFRLAASSFRRWSAEEAPTDDVEAYLAQLEAFRDPLRDGWSREAVIFEVALAEGFGPGSRVEKVEKVDNTVYRIHDPELGRGFQICLEDILRLDDLEGLELGPEDLFVCRDVALDDTTKANLSLQCRLRAL